MSKNPAEYYRYLAIGERDRQWGLWVVRDSSPDCLLQTSLEVGMGDRSALLDLPASPAKRCKELGIAFSRVPIKIVIVERHQERDHVPIPHHQHVLLLGVSHGGFPGDVFSP